MRTVKSFNKDRTDRLAMKPICPARFPEPALVKGLLKINREPKELQGFDNSVIAKARTDEVITKTTPSFLDIAAPTNSGDSLENSREYNSLQRECETTPHRRHHIQRNHFIIDLSRVRT
jgi:hypothetical protein